MLSLVTVYNSTSSFDVMIHNIFSETTCFKLFISFERKHIHTSHLPEMAKRLPSGYRLYLGNIDKGTRQCHAVAIHV